MNVPNNKEVIIVRGAVVLVDKPTAHEQAVAADAERARKALGPIFTEN